jgi:hypothetical protein
MRRVIRDMCLQGKRFPSSGSGTPFGYWPPIPRGFSPLRTPPRLFLLTITPSSHRQAPWQRPVRS